MYLNIFYFWISAFFACPQSPQLHFNALLFLLKRWIKIIKT